jgi:type III secretory pathway component EscS
MNTQYPFGKKLYIIATIFLMIGGIVNYDLMVINDPRNSFSLAELSVIAIFGSILMIPILASFIGVFIALLPNQSLTFKQKYFRSFLIALLAINTFYFVMCTYAAIRNSLG